MNEPWPEPEMMDVFCLSKNGQRIYFASEQEFKDHMTKLGLDSTGWIGVDYHNEQMNRKTFENLKPYPGIKKE